MRTPPVLALLACLVVPCSAGAATVSGTLDLAQGGASVGYDLTGATLLDGPAASVAVGLDGEIRRSAAAYAVASLARVSAPPEAIPKPGTCGGFIARPLAQAVEVADARALVQVESIALDVLAGRGVAEVELARVGDGPFGGGGYPAPGVLRVTTSGCVDPGTGEPVPGPDGGPYTDVMLVPAVAAGGEGLLGPAAPESLTRHVVRLRFADGAWRGVREHSEEASEFGPATRARVEVALTGAPAELGASCKVPPALTHPRTTVRSARAARSLLRRAGFERARFAGVRRGLVAGMRGRYVVLAGSSRLPCDRVVRFHRGAG